MSRKVLPSTAKNRTATGAATGSAATGFEARQGRRLDGLLLALEHPDPFERARRKGADDREHPFVGVAERHHAVAVDHEHADELAGAHRGNDQAAVGARRIAGIGISRPAPWSR